MSAWAMKNPGFKPGFWHRRRACASSSASFIRRRIGAVFIMDFTTGDGRIEHAHQLHFGFRLERVLVMLVKRIHRARLDLVLLAGFAIDDRTLALVAEHGLQMVLVPHVAFQAGRKPRLVK